MSKQTILDIKAVFYVEATITAVASMLAGDCSWFWLKSQTLEVTLKVTLKPVLTRHILGGTQAAMWLPCGCLTMQSFTTFLSSRLTPDYQTATACVPLRRVSAWKTSAHQHCCCETTLQDELHKLLVWCWFQQMLLACRQTRQCT